MTQTSRVPQAELSGVQGSLLKMAVRRKIGRVPDNVAVMWNHPSVFKDLMRAGAKVEKWDRVEANLASFAVMATAAEIGAPARRCPDGVNRTPANLVREVARRRLRSSRCSSQGLLEDLHVAGARSVTRATLRSGQGTRSLLGDVAGVGRTATARVTTSAYRVVRSWGSRSRLIDEARTTRDSSAFRGRVYVPATLRAPITWFRSRIGKAWTATTSASGARLAHSGHLDYRQVRLGDPRATAVAVEARAFLVLDLEEHERPGALVGGTHVVQAAVEVREHQAGGRCPGHLRGMSRRCARSR